MNKNIVFITEGGSKIGLGHLMRCIAIAQHAADSKINAFFIVNKDKVVSRVLNKYKFEFKSVADISIPNISSLVNEDVIIDSKRDLSCLVSRLQKNQCRVTLIDNITKARFQADNVIYPIEHFNHGSLDWKGAKGKVYYGAKYFPLRKDIKGIRKKHSSIMRNILVSFGGSDPNNLTLKVLQSLNKIRNDIKVRVLLGPAFRKSNKDKIVNLVRNSHYKMEVVGNNRLNRLSSRMDLCISALGVSTYEWNYRNIPVVLLCNYKNDKKDTQILERLKIATFLGYHRDVTPRNIARRIESIIEGNKVKTKRHIDGKGSRRILSTIGVL